MSWCVNIRPCIDLRLSCGLIAAFASADHRCAAPALPRAQTDSRRQFLTGVAATAEAVTDDAAGGPSSAAADTQQPAQQQRKAPEKQQQERAIVVGEKPAANSLLRRLEQVCVVSTFV
jgi:hypothetical protein